MLLRAVFWIGVVSVLMPHEPDLGLGRPHMLPEAEARDTSSDELRCGRGACRTALGFVDSFQSVAVRSLAQVKADIEADRHARFRDEDRAD